MVRASAIFSAVFLVVFPSGVVADAQYPASVPTTYRAITTRTVYPKPARPVLGPAGYLFIDPTFGSRMLRVTDAQTRPGVPGRSFTTASAAHQLAWSASSDRFWVRSVDGTFIPYTFDANTMTVARTQPTGTGDGGLIISSQVEPQFSFVSSNLLFGSRQDPVNEAVLVPRPPDVHAPAGCPREREVPRSHFRRVVCAVWILNVTGKNSRG